MVHVLEERPTGNGNKRSLTKLEKQKELLISTSTSGIQMSGKTAYRTSQSNNHHASMASETLVSSTSSNVLSTTTVTTTTTGAPNRTTHRQTPNIQPYSYCHMASLRRLYRTIGISTEATEVLLRAAWQRTSKQCNIKWRKFAGWCNQRKADPILCPQAYSQGCPNRTISEGKTGIQYSEWLQSYFSSTHTHIEGQPIGVHPLITSCSKDSTVYVHQNLVTQLHGKYPRSLITWSLFTQAQVWASSNSLRKPLR